MQLRARFMEERNVEELNVEIPGRMYDEDLDSDILNSF